MLLGEFHCSTDANGWLPVPSEFLSELAEGAAVTRGIEPCLSVYPLAEWRNVAEKLRERLPLTNRQARAFRRLIFSGATTCAVDRKGQIRLPEGLRRYADIGEEVVVVGLGAHLELWSPGRWREMSAAFEHDGVALADDLRDFGI
jgi:MraZ protein